MWEAVIGLEVHARLLTSTKIFCGCAVVFGAEPNTQVCPVCLGYPGALPVLNRKAVELAMRMAIATDCTIHPRSIFARKNYFYPDLPKGYQISQFDLPLATGGMVNGIRILRIHMEEDAGKLIHHGTMSHVDLNRAGTPLIEIVSEPDIHTAAEADAYLTRLRQTVMYTGVCDGNMEEGSLRCDANVSVRREGEPLGTRAEVKNLNSFRFLRAAIEFEIARQIAVLEGGGTIDQETRLFDPNSGETRVMRSKEEAHDYRYFPEPDLVPVAPTDAMRTEVRATMPELPAARRARLIAEWGIRDEDARVLLDVPGLADYAERAVAALKGGTPKDVANWVRQDVLAFLNDRGLAPAVLTPEMLSELVGLVAGGTISRGQAKDVLLESMEQEQWPDTIVRERGLAQVSDAGELGTVVDAVLARESATVEQYRASADDKDRKKKRNALMGQVMAELKGKGNPQLVNQLLDERLS